MAGGGVWTKANAEYTEGRALESWRQEEIDWGMFGVSEASLGVLGDVAGKDVVELGCGTGKLAAELMARRQLAIATRLGDPALASQCRIHLSYNLLQRGRLRRPSRSQPAAHPGPRRRDMDGSGCPSRWSAGAWCSIWPPRNGAAPSVRAS